MPTMICPFCQNKPGGCPFCTKMMFVNVRGEVLREETTKFFELYLKSRGLDSKTNPINADTFNMVMLAIKHGQDSMGGKASDTPLTPDESTERRFAALEFDSNG